MRKNRTSRSAHLPRACDGRAAARAASGGGAVRASSAPRHRALRMGAPLLLICGGRFMALCAFAALTTSNPEPRSIARKFLAIALESASLGHLSERRPLHLPKLTCVSCSASTRCKCRPNWTCCSSPSVRTIATHDVIRFCVVRFEEGSSTPLCLCPPRCES